MRNIDTPHTEVELRAIRRTKIVCTIGPACESAESIRELATLGMNVARLNFSHGTHDWHRERIRIIREVSAEMAPPLAILQDLSGPKLRIGELPEAGILLERGQECRLHVGVFESGPPFAIPTPIPGLLAQLEPGQQVFFDDGLLAVEVLEHKPDAVTCRVVNGGLLHSRKGIVAPGISIPLPSVTEKDFEDLRIGLELDVDWIAVSFVREARDLEPVRAAIRAAGKDTPIIAKVERGEAVENLAEILEASDGLMVARGDLGVELPLPQVPMLQKKIIDRCVRSGKPVITATQMLESMQHCARPTRAEVSDVANAIIDGTSAVMLSAETAIGEYPAAAVSIMADIALHTEANLDYHEVSRRATSGVAESITDAIGHGVAHIASDLNAACILCSTSSGSTARMVSRTRPPAPIVAATSSPTTQRRLALIWGVRSLLVPPTQDTDTMLAATVEGALAAGWIKHGDTVVIASASPIGAPGKTNLIKVETV